MKICTIRPGAAPDINVEFVVIMIWIWQISEGKRWTAGYYNCYSFSLYDKSAEKTV